MRNRLQSLYAAILSLRWGSTLSITRGLATATAITVTAAVLRVCLVPLTGSGAPFLLFFGAVLISSRMYGRSAGMLSAALGGALGTYLFSSRAGFTPTQLCFQWSLFFLEGCSIAWITHGFVTSRALAQHHLQALSTSDERYEMAGRATSDMIWDWDLVEGTCTFSDALQAIFRFPAGVNQFPDGWRMDRIHPADQAHVRASVERAFANQENHWEEEYRFAQHDGSYLHLLDRAYIVYNAAKKPKRMIGAMQNITQRREDQRILGEAEAKLRLVTDALPALVAYLDANGKHRFINAEYERWFQRSRKQMINCSFAELLLGESLSAQMQTSMNMALQGKHVRFEDTMLHPVRGLVPTLNTFVPDFDEKQQVRGFICLIHDISEQKSIERVLRESEEHYRVLAEVVPQIIWESRADGFFTYANSHWLRYSGMSQRELLGTGWLDAVHPSQRDQLLEKWQEAVRGGREYESEILLRRAQDGMYRWHIMRALALQDSRGGVRKWIGSLVDIHERKKSAQELQTLANFIPQLAWIANPRGDIYWLNQRWYDYTGSNYEQLRDHGWLDVIVEEHRQRVREDLKKARDDGTAFEGTFPILSADGNSRWFLTRAIPIFDEAGRISRWFGTSTDINDQLEVQSRLQDAQKELETAVRARDEFMSIASHELKTPLTSLQLLAQMAQRNLNRDPARACETHRVQKLVSQTGKSVERLTRLVDDMLDSSRIAMGKLSFKIEEFDIAELVQEVVERMVPQIRATGGHVSVVASKPARGHWDRFRLEQVVINLMTNAMRYGAGSPIEILVDRQGKNASLKIRDHGPGIAPDQQDRIFQQFERATPHSSISGLGLGLFICKEIVERHQGTIAVESTVGEGSTFVVNLPLSRPNQADKPATADSVEGVLASLGEAAGVRKDEVAVPGRLR